MYRINGDGKTKQIICFGTKNLSFITNAAYLLPLSETEFLFAQELSQSVGNLSISETSGTDFSIARISTDLDVKWV